MPFCSLLREITHYNKMKSTNDKIKVLRIIARLNIGGPAIHTILLTHYLNTDIQTRLVVGEVSEGEESMDYLLDQYDVRPVYINTLKRELSFIGDIRSVFSVYRIIREFKPDIVHTHTAKAGAIGRSAGILYNLSHFGSRQNRVRFVHSFHGHVFSGYFNRFTTFVFIMIEKVLAMFTDRIIAVSDALKKELVYKYKIAPDKKIKVIYNGYDLEPFLKVNNAGSKATGRAGAGSVETVITTVGRLVPIKGHKYLIHAFSRLKISARLVIAGDGILKDELQALSEKLGLSGRISFQGYRKDIISVYEQTGIFVLSSINEGAPVAVIEALACAKPVIATDVGGVQDLLGQKVSIISDTIYLCERGILVPPADDESIAAAINYLVNNPEIGYYTGMRGREFVKKKFTVNRLIKDMTRLYTEVLER